MAKHNIPYLDIYDIEYSIEVYVYHVYNIPLIKKYSNPLVVSLPSHIYSICTIILVFTYLP